MRGGIEGWTRALIWAAIAVVLATTGPTGMLLALVAAGCGAYRAHVDGVGVRVPRDRRGIGVPAVRR